MKRGNLLALLTLGHVFEHWYLGLMGPLMPFLAQDLGLSLTQVGLLLLGRTFFSGLSSAASGLIMDALGGGKWLLVGCLSGIALAYGGASLATGFLTLAPLYWLSGLASHSWHPPSMGLLGERFADRKGFALGIHGTGASVGQTLSPLLGGYLLFAMNWRQVIQINMIPLLAVSLLLWVFLPPVRLESVGVRTSGAWGREVRESLFRNPALLSAAAVLASRTFAQHATVIFLPFLLVRKFGSDPAWVGMALGLLAAASILSEPAMGYLSDRVPRKWLVEGGTVAGGLALLALSFSARGPLFLALLAVIGAGFISQRSVLFAHGFEITPTHLRGSVVGIMFIVNQIFTGLGGFTAGWLSDAFGPDKAFWFIGGVPLLCLPFFHCLTGRGWPPGGAAAVARTDSAPQTP